MYHAFQSQQSYPREKGAWATVKTTVRCRADGEKTYLDTLADRLETTEIFANHTHSSVNTQTAVQYQLLSVSQRLCPNCVNDRLP